MCWNNLIPWDGVTGGNGWTYDNPAGLFVDADNNIYYSGADGLPWVWCSAARLPYHLHHLQQIKARPPVHVLGVKCP